MSKTENQGSLTTPVSRRLWLIGVILPDAGDRYHSSVLFQNIAV